MKLISKFYNNLIRIKPSHRFFINIFFLKNIYSLSLKYLSYISVFVPLKKKWKVKIFKFNYSFYSKFIIYFIALNIIAQLAIIII